MEWYINKEKAIERINRIKPQVLYSEYGVGYERGLDDAIGLLNATPAEVIQPMKHGRWIWDSNAPHREHGAYKCNNCGCHSDFEENYCYNCGAKMDGGGNNEN